MCITFGNKKPERKIAPKGGIICYKVLNRNHFMHTWCSIVWSYDYIDGRKNKPVRIKLCYDKAEAKWTGHDGYHSYVKRPRIKEVTVVQCLIPKGAVYYESHWDGNKKQRNYISSRIVITGNLRTDKVV